MFKIFKRLFLGSSIYIFFISFISFYISFAILTLNDFYKKSLDNSLASKQPHIEMRYKSIEKVLSLKKTTQITNKIKNYKNIESCNAFTDGEMILKLFSYRNVSTTSALGNIRIIGLYPSIPFAYPLEEAKLYSMDFEDTAPTYKEFLYKFLENKKLSLINQTLFNMLSNPINSLNNFDVTSFFNNKKVANIKTNIIGTFIDFSEKPTIILYYKQANKLLNFPELRVSGFMIKVKNLDKMDSTVNFLKKEFPNLKITTWLDKNKKQKNIYSIFNYISMIVSAVILILSILISLLILYRTFIKKLNQIIILQKIGYDLRDKIIIYLSIVNTLAFSLALVVLHFSIKYIANYFKISLQETSDKILIFCYFVYILLFVILAKKILSQKVKI